MPNLNGALALYNQSLVQLDDRERYGRDVLKPVIESSPVLKGMLEDAFDHDYLRKFSFSKERDGSGGAYSPTTQTMYLNESSYSDRANLVFVLGHETQHARSLQGREEPHLTAMRNAIAAQAEPGGVLAQPQNGAHRRDYTAAIQGYVEGVRAEEAQAHIGGFNAYASYMEQRLGHRPSERELYDGLPGRMSDFIERTGVFPLQSYRMKEGLVRGEDGLLPSDAPTIDRMKGYYADKFPGTFGDNGLLDYRHQAIMTGWNMVQEAEQRITDNATRQAMNHSLAQPAADLSAYQPVENEYRIRFGDLQTNRAVLRYPEDNISRVFDLQHARTTAAFGGQPLDQADETQLADQHNPLKRAAVSKADAERDLREQGLLPHTLESRVAQFRGLFGRPAIEELSEPPLLSQSRTAFDKLGPIAGLEDRRSVDNALSALAVQAQRDGLTSINLIAKNTQGDHLVAVQGQDPTLPEARRSSVAIAEAAAIPAEESLKLLKSEQASTIAVAPTQPNKQMSM